jgi:hypothetical protein
MMEFEGRAQLVAHGGEELALHAVGLADAKVGLGQRSRPLVQLSHEGRQLGDLLLLIPLEPPDRALLALQPADGPQEEEAGAEEESHACRRQPERRVQALDLSHERQHAEIAERAGDATAKAARRPATKAAADARSSDTR